MAAARKNLNSKNNNKKIKVVIIHCSFVYSGGGERIVLEEARGLIKRGYEVEVYAPTVDYQKSFPEFLKKLKVKMLLPSFFDKLPLRNAIRMLVSSMIAPFLAFKFRDADIFVGANQPGVWIAFCIAKVLGKPYVIYLNQPNRIVYPRPIDSKYGWYKTNKDYHLLFVFLKIVKPILGYLDKYSIRWADAIMTNGNYIGDVIENVYGIKTIDNPAGAYTHKIGKPSNNRYLLITNRHDPQKRFDYVIKTIPLILKEFPKIKLLIPGPFTEHTKNLKSLVKKLKIEQNINFMGKISENKLQQLYRKAYVYCYPSPYEDFGLGPIEAGGWGVPTVAWNHAGPTVTVENEVTGLLAEPYKINDYAKCIITLLKDKRLRDRMGKNAYLRTKNEFSWEKHVNTMEDVVKKLV